MRLELGTFPVRDVVFADQTRYEDGLLQIDRDGLLGLIRKDFRIANAEIEVVRPGDSVRITTVRDALDPRVKVEGVGMVYPGICGRPVTTVGSGRTHRLAGVAILEVADVVRYVGNDGWIDTGFVDMSEPGNRASPLGSTINVALSLDVDRSLHIEDQNDALHAAALRVQDRLAATTFGLEPPGKETFALDPVDPALPRIVYIMGLRSPQHYSGSLTAFWTNIYGLTRLTPPWLLHPCEILDGAVNVGMSWIHVNNPVVLGMLRRHGKELCFLGVIAIRTRWSAQPEKDLTSLQAAKLASMIGAQGAIVTFDSGGNDFMEAIRTVQACERIGVKTVFMTFEEPPETKGPPLLEPLPEADAVVSLGVGRDGAPRRPLPPVERVIGAPEIVADGGTRQGRLVVKDALPSPHTGDPFGFGRLSCFSY